MAFVHHPGNDYSFQPVGKEGSSYSQASHPITDSLPAFHTAGVRQLPDAGPAEMAKSALIVDLTSVVPPSNEAVEDLVAQFEWREHERAPEA